MAGAILGGRTTGGRGRWCPTLREAKAQADGLVEYPERPQMVDVTTYYLRNQDVVDVADELLAFQVNASGGTQDTVNRARTERIPVVVFTYRAQ